MPIIKWTEDLQIGIKSIDDQHRHLINLINELQLAVEYQKGQDVIFPMIDKLHAYAEVHFLEEEVLLDKHDFPGKVDHVQEHDEFIGKLDDLKNRYDSNSEVLTIHIRNFILGWFYHHIKLNDMEYKRFLEQKQIIAPQLTRREIRKKAPPEIRIGAFCFLMNLVFRIKSPARPSQPRR